ncbi:MAG: diacylglycerol kinase [Parcubacteria group bacterium]|nr:diacylglycerol kinase [Parcubacteria group bacterium]
MDKLIQSFRNAIRGIAVALTEEKNFKIEIGFAVVVSVLLIYLPLNFFERGLIIFAIALVLILELINTAQERFLNLYGKEHDRQIGQIKDLMAGAVLVAGLASAVIGFLIFLPYVFYFLNFLDRLIIDFLKNRLSADVFNFLAPFFKKITVLGDWKLIFTLAISLAVIFFFKKRNKFANLILFSTVGAGILGQVLKLFFHRLRPDFGMILTSGSSFPSGHAALAVAFWGALMRVIGQSNWPKLVKFFFNSFLFLIILIISFSRVFLGVHYFSDVLGGLILGGSWLLFIIFWQKS